MGSGIIKYVLTVTMLHMGGLFAQQVNYSPYFRNYTYSHFQVAGRAGSYYWVQKEKPFHRVQDTDDRLEMFEIYDQKMNLVNTTSRGPLPYGTVKEYLVAGEDYFDLLLLVSAGKQTTVLLKRFTADGNYDWPLRIIDSLPFTENGMSFILSRSASRARLQLLAFQSTPAAHPLLHAIQFNSNWKTLHRAIVNDPNISQPCIQDDFLSFPAEDYDNLPVKLADNGEWLMSSPSRSGSGFLLFHFCQDGQYSARHIPMPSGFYMEDVALTIDNARGGASVGILSRLRNTDVKQLQVSHYSIGEGRFDFDSAYIFNAAAGARKNKNLVMEGLFPCMGRGYLFCKEYGREVREDGLENAPAHDRGDLAMFYFPTNANDSVWSGSIRAPQKTEFNWPSLSYLVMPSPDKVLLLYNAMNGFSDYATATVMDKRGTQADGAVVFWKFNRMLNFQRARQIGHREVAVPYLDRRGFAVIRL